MIYRRSLRLAPVLMVGLLAATACTDSGAGQAGPGTTNLLAQDIVLTSGLETVDSCDALLERIKDEAIERVGPYGFDQGNFRFGGPIALEEGLVVDQATDDSASFEGAAPATSAAADGSAERLAATESDATGEGGAGFSETNNQEQGVDEADLVKTDGDKLVIVSGNTLRVIDTTSATPRLTKTMTLPDETWGGQLFLDGDRALLMTSGWTDSPFLARSIPTDWYQGSPIGRLLEIDLVEGKVTRTLEFEGGYLSAREVDGTIRIVLTASANRFAFVYPSNDSATEAATEANKAVIESSTIEHWLPTFRITEGGETVSEGPIVECDRVHLPGEFAGFGSLILLTADLSNGLEISDALSIFTDAQTMYASTDRVAVATPRWPIYDQDGQPDSNEYSTAIHTFDITDADRASYVASGSVRGHLLNQYSLSEYDGYLRVATTDGNPWEGGANESESFVTVLAEEGGTLEPVGQVGGLGRGEQIFAVRFLGDKGYVVTFEQIDPLYTIDLSDPTDPEVLGELKIPGFSSYLHPVDDDHLIGVGTGGNEDGRTNGTVISLFDVSDLSDPQRIAELDLDQPGLDGRTDGGSSTPVSWDAKAFTYWEGKAIVPISWWSYDPERGNSENGSAAVLVDVDLDGNLTEIGRVSHPATSFCEDGIVYEDEPTPVPPEQPDPDSESTDAEASFVDPPADDVITPAPGISPDPGTDGGRYCETWTPEIQRSIVIDGDLYTLSEGGVKVSTFDGLDTVTWIAFEQR